MLKDLFVNIFLMFTFSNGVLSGGQFMTYKGCNATFVCYYSLGVSANWSNSLGPLEQGPKVIITNTNYYSVLTLTSVTTADNGNVTCKRNQSEGLEFSLHVQEVQCIDIFNTDTCKATVDGGDECTNTWMRKNCKKSCGLCPKFNCTISEVPTARLPAFLATTGRPTGDISGVGSKDPPTRSTTVMSFVTDITTLRTTQAINNNSGSFCYHCQNHVVLAAFLLVFGLLNGI